MHPESSDRDPLDARLRQHFDADPAVARHIIHQALALGSSPQGPTALRWLWVGLSAAASTAVLLWVLLPWARDPQDPGRVDGPTAHLEAPSVPRAVHSAPELVTQRAPSIRMSNEDGVFRITTPSGATLIILQ